MPEFKYARGRIFDSIRFISVLTALIEVCGTFLTQEGVAVESYADALRKSGKLLGFTDEDQESLAKLAMQRNPLAHKYLNFRWQAIQSFTDRKELITRLLNEFLKIVSVDSE